MGLPGKSKTVIVEPIEQPRETPVTIPTPEKVPA